MSKILLVCAFVVFVFCAVLGFGFLDAPELEEDFFGWLALGLAFRIGSKLT